MKNYAGHRLSPWLGHLMVSRSETARALLTPGEIMQLPPDDEIVMLAGLHPIRAKKARYFKDRRLSARILPPPECRKAPPNTANAGAWADMIVQSPTAQKHPAPMDDDDCDADNGGIRREPELPEHEEIILPPRVVSEFEFEEPMIEEDLAQSRRQADRMRIVARQAALDPGDGIEL